MNNDACAASSSTKKVNANVCKLIVNWLNKTNFQQKITYIKELKDGALLFHLIGIIVMSSDQEDSVEIKSSDVGERFEIINMVVTNKFLVESGLDIVEAMGGNEIELSKLSLVILSNGVALEIKEITDAFEKVDDFELYNTFYAMCEAHKIKFPPTSIELYEKFIFMPGAKSSHRKENRRITGLAEHFSPSSPVRRKLQSSENYLTSPMQKVALFSPREKHKRKNEEEFFIEKKNLEKEIRSRDNLIYDLQFEIQEKHATIDEIKMRIEEFERRQIEFNK